MALLRWNRRANSVGGVTSKRRSRDFLVLLVFCVNNSFNMISFAANKIYWMTNDIVQNTTFIVTEII